MVRQRRACRQKRTQVGKDEQGQAEGRSLSFIVSSEGVSGSGHGQHAGAVSGLSYAARGAANGVCAAEDSRTGSGARARRVATRAAAASRAEG